VKSESKNKVGHLVFIFITLALDGLECFQPLFGVENVKRSLNVSFHRKDGPFGRKNMSDFICKISGHSRLSPFERKFFFSHASLLITSFLLPLPGGCRCHVLKRLAEKLGMEQKLHLEFCDQNS